MNDGAPGFLPDGRRRLIDTAKYQAARERAIAEVRASYAPALSDPRLLRRAAARDQMRREIARRLEALAPAQALYLRAP
jgi:hypothetical protein